MLNKNWVDIQPLIKMIERERQGEYNRYLFEAQSPLSSLCDSAEVLGPLLVLEKVDLDRYKLSGHSFYSRFRQGDRVELRQQILGSDLSEEYSKDWQIESLIYTAPGALEIIIKSSKLAEIDINKEVFLFKESSILFSNILRKKIQEISSHDYQILLGTKTYNLALQNQDYQNHLQGLNTVQQDAVRYLISNNMNGAIQGPPGTGKTQLLKTVVSLALNTGMKVCVASFTNAAVDNLMGRLVRDEFKFNWVRVGAPERVNRVQYEAKFQKPGFTSPSFQDDDNQISLFGTTLHKLAFNFKNTPRFDLLVVDEAGQVPVYFWPFLAKLAHRIVMVGDQFQLPPVLNSKHSELPFDNVFSMYLQKESPMLELQYRMRTEIQAWSSEKFYKGKLKPHDSVAARDFFAHNPATLADRAINMVGVGHHTTGKTSKEEADFITDKIEKLLKTGVNPIAVGVICPYRMQAGIINSNLQNRLGPQVASEILVDTVERFQGQEREAIFISMGSAGATKEELQFLSNPRRLNVSITRAKSKLYCSYNPNLLVNSTSGSSQSLAEFLQFLKDGRTKITRVA